ncbi:MAG TPA: hypothetical protein VGK32_00215 [Vicinamibacterales bacterium]|jgi:hypothetical protein
MRAVAVAAWLVGGLVIWNGVFDRHIEIGARAYLDQQQAYVEGRGPRANIDRVMDEARASGLRSATGWALAELIPGGLVLAWACRRRRA